MTSTATSAYVPRGAAQERPLSPAARAALVAAACATILLFYVAAVVSMAILGVIIVALAIVILGGARFGLFNVLTPLIAPPSVLFMIMARRLWVREERPLAPTARAALVAAAAATILRGHRHELSTRRT